LNEGGERMSDSDVYAFNVGDEVILLDGKDNDPFDVGWIESEGDAAFCADDNMDDRVGMVLTIRCRRVDGDSVEYKVEGSDWWYSEVWLAPNTRICSENSELDDMFSGFCR
jgi:hypothetical protein